MLQIQVKMMQEMYEQTTYPLTPPWDDCELKITVLGLFESNGNFQWNSLVPRHYFHIIQSGRGIFNADGKDFEVGKDQLFCFFPGQYIEYHDFPETPWKYTWIGFEGPKVDTALAGIEITKKNPLVDLSDNLKFKAVLLPGIQQIIKNSYHQFFPVIFAWNLLNVLAPSNFEQPASDNQKLYEEAKILLDSQMENILTVDLLAERLGVNRSTLFRAFKNYGKISPKKYIDDIRFEKATELLIHSKMPISRIARACGFAEHHYFSNAFRKRFGLTPGEYRDRNSGGRR